MDVLDRLTPASRPPATSAAAADAASRLVELDPLDEPAHRRLMAILARSGDRAGAIRQYRATVAMLDRELGVQPLAETTELYEAIRDDRLAGPSRLPGTEARPRTATRRRAARPPADRRAGTPPSRRSWTRTPRRAVDGRIATISGEAGIGKSRLGEGVGDDIRPARRQRPGGTRVPGRGRRSPTGRSRSSCAPALPRRGRGAPRRSRRRSDRSSPGSCRCPRGSSSATSPPTAVPAARARLLDGGRRRRDGPDRGTGPRAALVDDLQWADGATREALRYLARRLAGRPLLLVLTWRPDDLDAAGASFAAPSRAARARSSSSTGSTSRRRRAGAAAAPAPQAGSRRLAGRIRGPAALRRRGARGRTRRRPACAVGVRALLHARLATVGETASQVLAAAAYRTLVRPGHRPRRERSIGGRDDRRAR